MFHIFHIYYAKKQARRFGHLEMSGELRATREGVGSQWGSPHVLSHPVSDFSRVRTAVEKEEYEGRQAHEQHADGSGHSQEPPETPPRQSLSKEARAGMFLGVASTFWNPVKTF